MNPLDVGGPDAIGDRGRSIFRRIGQNRRQKRRVRREPSARVTKTQQLDRAPTVRFERKASTTQLTLARSDMIGQGSAMQPRSGGTRLLLKLVRLLLGGVVVLAFGLAGLLVAYRYVPPVSTLMLARWALGEPVDRTYVPLEQISMEFRKSVVVSEDSRFCGHEGVDWESLRRVIDRAGADGPTRGASTITMQTAKNLFLWPTRSYVRKALEIPLALLVDAAWPKRRILEIYLNVAEWGDGIFGAEAAAEHYFAKSASRIDAREAALLATALPNPHRRNAVHPARGHAALARKILARMQAAGPDLVACIE
jgi:monofunctional biosynthetic peptidoglycan transglycosylase